MYKICDKVTYFNTVTRKLETVEIRGMKIVATGISKDEKGENVLDGQIVLYETVNGPTLAETEVWPDKETAKAELKKIVDGL